MSAADVVGIWGAVLSTLLAIAELARWRRERPQIKIKAGLVFSSIHEDDVGSSRGTPIKTQLVPRQQLVGWQEVLLELRVANAGRQAIQVVGVVVESVTEDKVHTIQVVPRGLPLVLDLLTSIVVTIQKEFLDQPENIVLLGVVDVLGNRHTIRRLDLQGLVHESLALPTRVATYQMENSSDAEPLRAFQAHDAFVLTTRMRTQGIVGVRGGRVELSEVAGESRG